MPNDFVGIVSRHFLMVFKRGEIEVKMIILGVKLFAVIITKLISVVFKENDTEVKI